MVVLLLERFEVTVDDGGIVSVQEDHSLGDLFGDVDAGRPGELLA